MRLLEMESAMASSSACYDPRCAAFYGQFAEGVRCGHFQRVYGGCALAEDGFQQGMVAATDLVDEGYQEGSFGFADEIGTGKGI